MLDKSRRTDQEVINLSKKLAKKLTKNSGLKHSANDAVKIALKEALLK